MGAWIETSIFLIPATSIRSPLAWGRGSKQTCRPGCKAVRTSPLAWGRGSKRRIPRIGINLPSRPSRGGVDRNLTKDLSIKGGPGRPSRGGVDRNKLSGRLGQPELVAPRVGAWIETPGHPAQRRRSPGRPSRGGVDRNSQTNTEIGNAPASPLAWGRGSKQKTDRSGPGPGVYLRMANK